MKSSYYIFNVVKGAEYTLYMLDKGIWKETKFRLGDQDEASREFRKLIDKDKTNSLLKIGLILRGWL